VKRFFGGKEGERGEGRKGKEEERVESSEFLLLFSVVLLVLLLLLLLLLVEKEKKANSHEDATPAHQYNSTTPHGNPHSCNSKRRQ